jgi:hypothetical protein
MAGVINRLHGQTGEAFAKTEDGITVRVRSWR